jgi:gamma-glutamyltranspeptidase/glutathione hydrolase
VTVTGAGFLLNDEMDDFAAAPGRPNQYGLVQGEANAIAAGKRMLSSMTPTIVVAPDDRVRLVLGSPGGPAIITTVLQVMSNVLDHGMTLAAAVEAPRIHHQALPDTIFVEPAGLAGATVQTLRDWGYSVEEREGSSGNVSAIASQHGAWEGVADPRRQGGVAAPASVAEREPAHARAALR